jgi:hypothetical protein
MVTVRNPITLFMEMDNFRMLWMFRTRPFCFVLFWFLLYCDGVSSFLVQHGHGCKLFFGSRHVCLKGRNQPNIQYSAYLLRLQNRYMRIRKRLHIVCSDSDLKDVASSSPRTVTDSSEEPVIQSWVTNTARNFLINLFGTRSPFRKKDEVLETANSSRSVPVCESPAYSDLDTLDDRPRADRFLSVIRSGVRHGLFDGENQERDWTKVQDERVNREEFGEAVMAAGLPDMIGVDIDDLFEGMDADHDGELR